MSNPMLHLTRCYYLVLMFNLDAWCLLRLLLCTLKSLRCALARWGWNIHEDLLGAKPCFKPPRVISKAQNSITIVNNYQVAIFSSWFKINYQVAIFSSWFYFVNWSRGQSDYLWKYLEWHENSTNNHKLHLFSIS
jgi:hypothetical protein